MTIDADIAATCNAWPFQEARKLVERYSKKPPEKGYVLFETGYGPSGLPHIGTFGEVARTTMVRHAFSTLCDIPTRLFAFSDDMDGLRKVPGNVPNQDMLQEHLNKPLTQVPDPFGTHESFAHHNNARLCAFLDQFGFDYEFQSATSCYKGGMFDAALMKVLENFEAIRNVMLPTLGEERRKTYSPILPISPKTGHVLQVPVQEWDAKAGTIVFEDEDGTMTELPVTGGQCKLQWKADWAMRWYALGVDYEMAGKDLIDSVTLSSKICRILGSRPPEGFNYELFLDDKGEKISKSKGNGLTIEDWLRYASPESLSLYMFQAPRKAKRLYFDVIPRAVDEYVAHLNAYAGQPQDKQLSNPVWHIHAGMPPTGSMPVAFGLLLNLVSAAHSDDKAVLWNYIGGYVSDVTPESHPMLDDAVGYAIAYYEDFIRPTLQFRLPDEKEQAALADLATALKAMAADTPGEVIQTEIYEIGKRHAFENLRDWFKALYEILLGQSQGPRMGSFIALYGIEPSLVLISKVLSGEKLG